MNSNTETFIGEVVDLFCGIGGISHGFRRSGFDIRAGYDVDISCRYGFEGNNSAPFMFSDIGTLKADEITARYSGSLPTVLVGCAPCQPFSTYRKGKCDDRWSLLAKFAKLATQVNADFVTMENVPGLINYRGGTVFENFIETLSEVYPFITHEIVNCADYGVPQNRRRLVVIASHTNEIQLCENDKTVSKSVLEAIQGLPVISAGEVDSKDPLHRASGLSELNLRRIQHSKPGGSWRDWPEELVAECHKNKKGKGYRSVYGRMDWNGLAPTMTTQCYGYGNGRFGHPEQDRAITLREAAIFQSFPLSYNFFPKDTFPGYQTVGRWIGNAVPVALAEAIARRLSKEILIHA